MAWQEGCRGEIWVGGKHTWQQRFPGWVQDLVKMKPGQKCISFLHLFLSLTYKDNHIHTSIHIHPTFSQNSSMKLGPQGDKYKDRQGTFGFFCILTTNIPQLVGQFHNFQAAFDSIHASCGCESGPYPKCNLMHIPMYTDQPKYWQNIDYFVTMQCSAGKPRVPTPMCTPSHVLHPPTHRCRPSTLLPRQHHSPTAVAPAAGKRTMSHRKNRPRMA